MRFLCGIAAGSGMRLELTGDRRLCQHSMRNVKEPLEAMGATVALKNYSVPPILVEGETVRPIDYFLPIGSSQVKSSILLCALTGKVRAIVKEGTRSRNHMEILLKEMGADITVDEKNNSVDMKESEIKGKKLYVCGDFTEAVYYLAQGLLSGRTECKNVGVNPTRTRVLQLFRRMGAKIKITNRRMLCGEPIADIVAEKSDLKAILVTDEEAYSVFDELPALAVVMGMARGESVIAEHKAIKDLDADLFDEISGAIRSVGGNCRRFSSPGAAGIAIKGVEIFRFSRNGGGCRSHRVGRGRRNRGRVCDRRSISAFFRNSRLKFFRLRMQTRSFVRHIRSAHFSFRQVGFKQLFFRRERNPRDEENFFGNKGV